MSEVISWCWCFSLPARRLNKLLAVTGDRESGTHRSGDDKGALLMAVGNDTFAQLLYLSGISRHITYETRSRS